MRQSAGRSVGRGRSAHFGFFTEVCTAGGIELFCIGVSRSVEGSFDVVLGNVDDGVSFGGVREAVNDGWNAG